MLDASTTSCLDDIKNVITVPIVAKMSPFTK